MTDEFADQPVNDVLVPFFTEKPDLPSELTFNQLEKLITEEFKPLKKVAMDQEFKNHVLNTMWGGLFGHLYDSDLDEDILKSLLFSKIKQILDSNKEEYSDSKINRLATVQIYQDIVGFTEVNPKNFNIWVTIALANISEYFKIGFSNKTLQTIITFINAIAIYYIFKLRPEESAKSILWSTIAFEMKGTFTGTYLKTYIHYKAQED